MSELVLEPLLTPKDVGAALQKSASFARRLRDFPWKNVGTGSRPVLVCRREDFDRWLAQQDAA